MFRLSLNTAASSININIQVYCSIEKRHAKNLISISNGTTKFTHTTIRSVSIGIQM